MCKLKDKSNAQKGRNKNLQIKKTSQIHKKDEMERQKRGMRERKKCLFLKEQQNYFNFVANLNKNQLSFLNRTFC